MSAPLAVNLVKVYFLDADGNTITRDDGTAIGSAEGLIMMGKDGTNARMLTLDASGNLASLPLPTGAATQATLASLEGKDFATQTTLAAILTDTGQIEALLTTIDIDTGSILANQTNKTQFTKLTDGTNDAAVRLDGDTLALLAGFPVMGKTAADVARYVLMEDDGTVRVASQPPSPPPGTTEFVFAVDDAELDVGSGGDVSSPHTSLSPIIGNGLSLKLQQIQAGTEGDSSENGSVVEVYWREGGGPTDHLIDRFYVVGTSIQVPLPDTNKARDDTVMTGDGTTTRLAVVRRRLSVSALEIDFVVRGFTD